MLGAFRFFLTKGAAWKLYHTEAKTVFVSEDDIIYNFVLKYSDFLLNCGRKQTFYQIKAVSGYFVDNVCLAVGRTWLFLETVSLTYFGSGITDKNRATFQF